MTGLLLAAAWAQDPAGYASEPQEVVFEDTWPVFAAIAFDTGPLPSPGDPITVRFHVTPTGGVVAGLEGDSELAWPGPSGGVEQRVVGVPGSGWFGVDSEVEIAAEVGIDIFGLWSGTVDLWREQVVLFAEADFDPMLLGAAPVAVDLSGTGLIPPFVVGYSVFPGLDINLTVDLYPQLAAALSGVRVEVTSEDGSAAQVAEGAWVELPAPALAADALPLSLAYVADQQAALAFTIEPGVRLDTFLGGFQLLSFPIDVPLVSAAVERAWPPVAASHPLPVLGPLPPSLDAGDVAVAGLANVPLVVTNAGAMPLQGVARIVGSDDFTVFPEEIYVAPGGSDGLMVSFSPVMVGARAVELELRTSDPAHPVVRIPITGLGVGPDPEPPDADPYDDTYAHVNGEEVRGGCGCASAPSGGAWWAGALLLAARRRSRR